MTEAQPGLVVFDLDDTLYEYEPSHRAGTAALLAFASAQLGVKATAFERALSTARENVKARLGATASSHSRLLYCHEALELIGVRSEPQIALTMEQEYWRTYISAATLRPGALDLLQTLRYNGVTTAIVTDLTAQIQFRKIIHLDLARYIDHIVCSEETPHEKASLAPFELLFERVAPGLLEHVWFIGDNDFDAPVARLIDKGAIASGRGFRLHGASSDPHTVAWHDFSEIEKAAEQVFGE
ncbi:HAD family hydrolase [Herbiconiux sp.]|jgi:putative hydrolase of the HAD superfamily|uniref:HAD family hydrolase n=1 Tax=Herbiconiux sp. TaxID=1871186 RepID=UPI0025C3D3CE|nr:HAD family hydrolase [Herbiconiux sp.]